MNVMSTLPEFAEVDWSALPWRVIGTGAEEKAFSGEGISLALHRLDPANYVPMAHAHANEQIVWMIEGACDVVLGDPTVGERIVRMAPGSVLAIPPHVAHKSIPIGDAPVLSLDVFTPARSADFDYRSLNYV